MEEKENAADQLFLMSEMAKNCADRKTPLFK